MYIDKDELLELLEARFGNLKDDYGCYIVNADGEHEWLSVKAIVDIIDDCEEYDTSDF